MLRARSDLPKDLQPLVAELDARRIGGRRDVMEPTLGLRMRGLAHSFPGADDPQLGIRPQHTPVNRGSGQHAERFPSTLFLQAEAATRGGSRSPARALGSRRRASGAAPEKGSNRSRRCSLRLSPYARARAPAGPSSRPSAFSGSPSAIHARIVALAQYPANTGAFIAKPRELPCGTPVDCTTTFGWWWWKNGSSGRIRTYNPSVNSRMLYH